MISSPERKAKGASGPPPPTPMARTTLEDIIHYYVERILQTRKDRVECYKSLAVRAVALAESACTFCRVRRGRTAARLPMTPRPSLLCIRICSPTCLFVLFA
jgi:hypothetical protein